MGILCLTGVIIGIIRTIVSIIIITRSIVPRSVFTKSSSIKLYKEDKRLLFNSDPWPPAEQKLEMPCDINNIFKFFVRVSKTLTKISLELYFNTFVLKYTRRAPKILRVYINLSSCIKIKG